MHCIDKPYYDPREKEDHVVPEPSAVEMWQKEDIFDEAQEVPNVPDIPELPDEPAVVEVPEMGSIPAQDPANEPDNFQDLVEAAPEQNQGGSQDPGRPGLADQLNAAGTFIN